MGPLAIPAITAGLEVGYNIYRGIKADKALKELNKQRMPRYMDAAGPLQQNLSMASRQAQMGLSPQATALARGTAANQMAGQFRAATDLGGGQLGSAIGRIGAMNTNQLGLQLGTQDQMARERGMQQMMGVNQQLSGLQQKDVAQDINLRLQKEQGYGMAKQQAIMGGLSAISGLGQAAMYQNIYGTNPTPTNSGANSGNEYFADTNKLTQNYMQRNPGPSVGGARFTTPLSMRYQAQAPVVPNVPLANFGAGPEYNNTTSFSNPTDMSGYGLPSTFRVNPYRMNRRFMNNYDATRGEFGDVQFIRR
jgi:hypothetical protein